MKALIQDLRSSIVAVVVLGIVCCGLYPVMVFGVAQVLFKDKANGSLVYDKSGHERIMGSALLGQQFTSGINILIRGKLWRATGMILTSSGGSNLGPTSQKLNDAIKDRIADYRKRNGLKDTDSVPADAVTASGSGLDPHISLQNAEFQGPRVAKARGLSIDKIKELIKQNTDAPDFGVLGDAGVNVLKLNLALDQTK